MVDVFDQQIVNLVFCLYICIVLGLTCVCTDCPLNRCNVSNDGFCLVIRTHEGHKFHYTTRKCVSPKESICFLKLDGLPSSTHCPEARCCNNTDLCNTNETNLHSLCALKSSKFPRLYAFCF